MKLNTLKKTIAIIIYLLFPATAHAQNGVFRDNVDQFNTSIFGSSPANDLTTIGGIINAILPYIFVIAGLVLFLMLIGGGLTLLTSVGNPEAAEKGKKQIGAAVGGFLIIFASYWIIQIVQVVLGVNILTN